MARLGIIGAGHVGEIVAYTAALRGGYKEIVLYDIDEKRLDGVVSDLEDADRFYPHDTTVVAGDIEEVAKSDQIVVCSGRIPENAQRRDEYKNNYQDVTDYIPRVMAAGFKGIFVVVTNPCDAIAYAVWKSSGTDASRVIGSGTALDSERSRTIIAREFGLSADSVDSMMLGEHGDSQFLPYSQVRLHHVPFDRYIEEIERDVDKAKLEETVVYKGHRAFFGKGSTQYGIANTVNDILDAVHYDTKRTLQVSTLHRGEYGLKDVYLSTPCVIGKDGIERVIELDLTDEERKKYAESAEIVRSYIISDR
ncbi:MAG: L-lactate dehydrogenase [Peptoniphilus sp.]|nr:L-lactate dehydrogenase [Peptoniphilus sp.]MDD7363636.1 L-lactate dehydrogenase [Bacillota bacterium]MDY6044718.1 L-lactate dehydrogenase [Peptoniphilus sp.]